MNQPTLDQTPRIDPRAAALQDPNVAYVKPVEIDGQQAYAVHAGDGTPLAVAPSRAMAFALIRQNELEPADIH